MCIITKSLQKLSSSLASSSSSRLGVTSSSVSPSKQLLLRATHLQNLIKVNAKSTLANNQQLAAAPRATATTATTTTTATAPNPTITSATFPKTCPGDQRVSKSISDTSDSVDHDKHGPAAIRGCPRFHHLNAANNRPINNLRHHQLLPVDERLEQDGDERKDSSPAVGAEVEVGADEELEVEEDSLTFRQGKQQTIQSNHEQQSAAIKMPPKPFDAIPGPRPSLPFVGTNWIYFPIVGYYQSMKLHEANLDKYRRYGPIMKEEYQRGYPSVTVFDPKDIKEVFMREGTCPSRPVLPYVIKHRHSDPSRYPNVGLANMMGKEWFELRQQLAPLLLSKELKKRHIGSQNRVSSRLVNYIKNLLPASNSHNSSSYFNANDQAHYQGAGAADEEDRSGGTVTNIQEVFYRFSMESIMNLCTNQELGCLNATSGDNSSNSSNFEINSHLNSSNREVLNQTVQSDGESIFQAAMNFFEAQHKLYYGLGLWKYYNTRPYRQLCDSQNAIHHIASKYIDVALDDLKRRKRYLNNANNQKQATSMKQQQQFEEHESLLETLYSTNKFNDLEIKSTIVDFIGGGIYTVANTLTMALYLLASNPSVQEQLYQEICHVFKNEIETGSDIHIDLDKLEQLKFLKLCLKESYRLLPTIPGIARTLQKDLVLSNYVVPKNTLVFCNFMVTCRLPEYFDDPDSYNPSRWERVTSDGGGGSAKLKGDLAFCLLPFGHGVRKCIGHNFAELEIYVALSKLIRNFKVRTINQDDAKSLELSFKFIVVPEKPVTLKFIPRKEPSSN